MNITTTVAVCALLLAANAQAVILDEEPAQKAATRPKPKTKIESKQIQHSAEISSSEKNDNLSKTKSEGPSLNETITWLNSKIAPNQIKYINSLLGSGLKGVNETKITYKGSIINDCEFLIKEEDVTHYINDPSISSCTYMLFTTSGWLGDIDIASIQIKDEGFPSNVKLITARKRHDSPFFDYKAEVGQCNDRTVGGEVSDNLSFKFESIELAQRFKEALSHAVKSCLTKPRPEKHPGEPF